MSPLLRTASRAVALATVVALGSALGLAALPELRGPVASAASTASTEADGAAHAPSAGPTRSTRAASQPGATPRPEPVATDQILAEDLPGRALLERHPRQVEEVAERSGLEPAELTTLLRHDDTVRISPQGRVYFREQLESSPGALGSTPALSRSYPLDQTFSLQSKPGASRTILIDVDGADVSGTAWNTGEDAMPNGVWPGFDSDGNPASFTAGEHAWVQELWRQVAETYAPFDVNVTTRDTGVDAWDRTTARDTQYGARVVVTTSTVAREAACGSCLGVAWLNTFGALDSGRAYQPAWVFASRTMSPTVAAQAVSHEVGHNLGLSHDGLSSPASDYYPGTAHWGPIMGAAANRAVSQWSRGEYTRASRTEDDLAVITQHNLPLRTDDHGDTTGTARELGAAAAYDVEGVIATRTDVDVFRPGLHHHAAGACRRHRPADGPGSAPRPARPRG